MTGDQQYTPYQKKIIRRYYDHKEDLSVQRLSEIVSELYLCTSEKKAATLWKQAEAALAKSSANPAALRQVLATRDVKRLADLVQSLF
jgi:hypothetical protein